MGWLGPATSGLTCVLLQAPAENPVHAVGERQEKQPCDLLFI